MKKWIASLMILIMICIMAVPAMAAEEAPVITLQPQSYCYSEYSTAIYTVKATGTNLKATWYLEYKGKTYNASKIGGAVQPWEGYAGETYGAQKLDDNTFTFFFGGIEEELDGAELWCEISDGKNKVISQVAVITVGDYGAPPEILEIPAAITVRQGEEAEIRCIARSGSDAQLEYIWYETSSGLLQDIQAVDRGAETSDFLLCDTTQTGTRYYICGITTTAGGKAYSSAVAVTVEEAPVEETTAPTESTQPEATQPETTGSTTPATTENTEPAVQKPAPEENTTPWWILLLVGLGAAGIGVGVAILLTKKK